MLYYVTLYCIILHYIRLYHVISYYIILYDIIVQYYILEVGMLSGISRKRSVRSNPYWSYVIISYIISNIKGGEDVPTHPRGIVGGAPVGRGSWERRGDHSLLSDGTVGR